MDREREHVEEIRKRNMETIGETIVRDGRVKGKKRKSSTVVI